MGTVVCHTPGCENAEIPIELNLTDVDRDGRPFPIELVFCGVCNQPITDITRRD